MVILSRTLDLDIRGHEVLTTNAYRFGIEFAGEVVKADGNVRNLAWRICNAKQVLVSSRPVLTSPLSCLGQLLLTHRTTPQAPYSMASTPGRETPDAKY